MPTSSVNLSTQQYVRCNVGYTSMLLQAHRDSVRVVLSENKPARYNSSFMLLNGGDAPLHLPVVDTNVWVLAITDRSSLICTESSRGIQTVAGAGDLTIDAWGSQKVSFPTSIFHGMWTFDIPASMWFMYENAAQVYTSTNITSSGGVANLTTDATNTVLLLEGRECPRYQPNRGHLFSMAGWFPDKLNDGVRDFGMFTAENGVFFRLKSDGDLYAVLRRGSTEVLEERIDTSVIPGFDVEKNNIYDIQFQWRAAGNYKFYIGNPRTGVQQLVHSFDLLGTLTSASIENPALPVAFKATRTTEDVEMNIGCADITSENGTFNNNERYASAYTENLSASSADQPVLTLKFPTQINSETNTRTCSIARITVTSSQKKSFKVWKTRTFSAIAGAVYKDVPGSVVQSDSTDMDATATRATSYTTSSMDFVQMLNCEANAQTQSETPYVGRIQFTLVRGDFLCISCDTGGTVGCSVEWGEQI